MSALQPHGLHSASAVNYPSMGSQAGRIYHFLLLCLPRSESVSEKSMVLCAGQFFAAGHRLSINSRVWQLRSHKILN